MRSSNVAAILALPTLLALLPAMTGGCARDAAAEAQEAGAVTFGVSLTKSSAHLAGMDARPVEPDLRMRVDVYLLAVPLGTVSRNDAFWHRVDEHAVGVATYDVLFKNGVRVGTAPLGEWAHFRDLLARYPASSQKSSIVGERAEFVELPMRKLAAQQAIFYLDGANQLHGRTYEDCENFVTLSFEPAPREPEKVRVALAPVVRTLRARPQFTRDGDTVSFAYKQDERIYDLNLMADVPAGEFLIVAPSDQATWPSSVGNRFFVFDGPAERLESVLLIVPRQPG